MSPHPISKLLREPLLQFLLLGAVIFALSILLSRGGGAGGGTTAGGATNDKTLIISADRIALLRSGFQLDNRREPTDAELLRLIDAYIRQEILVREARAQGLDRDDSIVRNRLVQKMEFAIAEPPPPPDSDLEKYLSEHPQSFRNADGKLPALSEIRSAVLAAWTNDQRKQEMEAIYQKYRAQYHVDTPATQNAGGKS